MEIEGIERLLYKQKIAGINYESLVELVEAQHDQIEELKAYIKTLELVIENSVDSDREQFKDVVK